MQKNDICHVNCVDKIKVDRLKSELEKQDVLGLAKIFKALSDETRMKIVYSLYIEEELCVCDVGSIVGASTAAVSHHLRLLNRQGIAKYRKEGKLVYYSLVDDHVKQLVRLASEHQKEVFNHG
ncbi:ArsR/SmtB family transcription factor [Bacillus massilinigeriensis]|uniref:ArsR/SmtB family transcription factor n=1 Tax=Bacillus mediterraneensis TaxID=1805474 RepID=UPI0008F94548|nr:metalloregulator ArsR/SmtB family transcription factor [Bacillus mediterraneensis]